MPISIFLKLLGIVCGSVLVMAVLLRAAVTLTNRINRHNGPTDDIKTHGFVWSTIVATIVFAPTVGWIGAGLPGVQPSQADFHIVPVLIALPISILITGGILSLMLSTTWRRGMEVALCLDAIALVVLAVVTIATQVFAG